VRLLSDSITGFPLNWKVREKKKSWKTWGILLVFGENSMYCQIEQLMDERVSS